MRDVASFFHISLVDGNNMPEAAQVVLDQIERLMAPPTNAESFLVADCYGRGTHNATGDAYKQAIFDGLHQYRKDHPFKFRYAFVDFARLWDAVLGTIPPGYAAFGYESTAACVHNSSSVADACANPEARFYWIPGHPSKETHRIMADYVESVLDQC
jgi:phospholipase/lecithinase/hemolysin